MPKNLKSPQATQISPPWSPYQPQTSTTTTIKPPHSTLNVNRTIQEKGKRTVIIIEDRFSVHSLHVNSVIKNHKQYPTATRSQFPAQALLTPKSTHPYIQPTVKLHKTPMTGPPNPPNRSIMSSIVEAPSGNPSCYP